MPDQLTTLDDGQLHFKIRNRGTGEETDHSIDVLLLRLTCEECEATHHLQTNERGEYIATAAFLNDLAGRLAAMGVADCTPSVALQLWSVSVREIEALKKNTSEQPSAPSGSESSHAPESGSMESHPTEPLPNENASGY